MSSVNFKHIAGYAILGSLLTGMYTPVAVKLGIIVALLIFGASIFATGLIVVAIWLLTSD